MRRSKIVKTDHQPEWDTQSEPAETVLLPETDLSKPHPSELWGIDEASMQAGPAMVGFLMSSINDEIRRKKRQAARLEQRSARVTAMLQMPIESPHHGDSVQLTRQLRPKLTGEIRQRALHTEEPMRHCTSPRGAANPAHTKAGGRWGASRRSLFPFQRSINALTVMNSHERFGKKHTFAPPCAIGATDFGTLSVLFELIVLLVLSVTPTTELNSTVCHLPHLLCCFELTNCNMLRS